ncbi:MAG: acyl-CoA dehydrogenase family protein, partial [Myxococcota bacterium]
MTTATLNRRDLEFILFDWLDVASLCDRPRFAMHSRAETFEPILSMADRLAAEQFATHAAKLDAHEPTFDGERVVLLPEVREALDAFIEAGFLSASFDTEHGGLQLPYSIHQAAMALFYAANTSTAAYPMLSMAAANLLATHANAEQRKRYLAPLLDGRAFGTMCLSEPHAGSSLSDIRTVAKPADDGTYRLVGNKMWISGAEHDLSDNIIHLVLAKIPGGPPGVKGISLFIVPKFLIHDDGTLGARNDVAISGLNHKMGYRGTVNTVLNLGEDQGGAVGYLVGEPHRGLTLMFHMMNEARIGVGLGAAALGCAGYRFSLNYARERPQGRLPWNKGPASPPVPILEHPDVRRMLLAQKAWSEGGLALCLYCARLVDEMKSVDNDATRDALSMLLDILTPIAKAWPSEYALEANKLAIQVLGGYGYSTEYPVERLYRDNRLNAIHEGTNGIQALDLLGRKVTMRQGAAFRLLMDRISRTLSTAREYPSLQEHTQALSEAHARVQATTAALAQTALQG